MGYRHTDNLYKNKTIQLLLECYALEKIHGTSAHVRYQRNQDKIIFFSGGAKHDTFVALFDEADLLARFRGRGANDVTVYGEAYGGNMQGMSATYGPKLRFVAFEVLMGERWLSVPEADDFACTMGLEFVAYERVSTDQASLDVERDRPSRQAIRNGCGDNHKAEGVVLRPLQEMVDARGNRVICKHKRADFSERKSKADTMPPEKLLVLAEAKAIADEWVTPMRLGHVTDALRAQLQRDLTTQDIPAIVTAMVEDVFREGRGEIVESKEARKAIGTKAVQLFRAPSL